MQMNIRYDETTDSVYFVLSDEKPYESEEVEKDVIVDYNRQNDIVAIEVLHFKTEHANLELPIDGSFSLKKAS